MKKLGWMLLLALGLQGCGGGTALPEWLAGTWVENKPADAPRLGEFWQLKDGKLSGHGLYISGTDTTHTEQFEIAMIDGALTYIATVEGNEAPVHFPAVTHNKHELVFELPEYDFPQRMRYVYRDQRLLIHVEGEENGIEKSMDLELVPANPAPWR